MRYAVSQWKVPVVVASEIRTSISARRLFSPECVISPLYNLGMPYIYYIFISCYYSYYYHRFQDHEQISVRIGHGNKWRFICMTRDGSNGRTELYGHDEAKSKGENYLFPGDTFQRDGEIYLAGRLMSNLYNPNRRNLALTLTQINVWDRVFTNDEIVAFARRENCDGIAGNVLDWEGFKTGLHDLTQFRKSQPSSCTNTVE